MIEYETKVLDIDVKEIISKLENLGAKKKGDYFMKRWMYNNNSIEKKWLRLRNNGIKSTVTYKHGKTADIGGVEELECDVEDFDKMHEILMSLNFETVIYQENKRTSFEYNGIEFDIDSWPKIPTFLEVESDSKESVLKGLKILDLEGKDIGNVGTVEVYEKYGLILHDFKILKFDN